MPKKFVPLIVEAELASPWIDRGDPIHFDSIILQAFALRHGIEPPSRQDNVKDIQAPSTMGLPIAFAVEQETGIECAVCSATEVIYPTAPAVMHQARRRDLIDWDLLQAPVNVSMGPSKDMMVRTEGRVSKGVRWYVWGNRADIDDLLALLWGRRHKPHGFFGSVRRGGNGQITKWEVIHADFPADRCWINKGLAVRHLPPEWITRGIVFRPGTYRAPYWHPQRQTNVPAVGTNIEISSRGYKALMGATCW